MPQVEIKFIWSFLPDVFEAWEELTLIAEAFLEELFNTVNISVKIPVKNTEMYKQNISEVYCNEKYLPHMVLFENYFY